MTTSITARVANIATAVAAIKTHRLDQVVAWNWCGLVLRSMSDGCFGRILDVLNPETGVIEDTVIVRPRWEYDGDTLNRFVVVNHDGDVLDDGHEVDAVFGSALTVILLHAYGA